MWIASWIEFDRALGGARAMGDQVVGAVKIEPADLADAGRDQQVGRIAGQPRAGDAVLHDVEGIDHDRGDARPSAAAEELALHGALGGEEFADAAFRRLGFGHASGITDTETPGVGPWE